MDHQYRSPHRPISKSTSTCKPSKSVAKRSQYKQQSESKSHIQAVKDICEGQQYKNLLNRLLRSENLGKFVREAEKYVYLSEETVAAYKSANVENERSRKEFQEYGRALLRDGSFIRYYCKLVEREFTPDRKAIRQYFIQKYRHEVCIREKMFIDYFKEELTPQQDSLTFSFSKSKPKEKREGGLSRSKSHKKAKTQYSFCMKENDKNEENLGQKESNQSELTKEQSKTEIKLGKSEKKGKVVHFEKEPEEETGQEEDNYRSPYIKYNPKETQQQRDFRLSGLVKQSSKVKSSQRKRNVVSFHDQLKTNQRLRQIYEQLMKEKEERDKLIPEKSTNSSKPPIVRSSVKYDISFSEIKLKIISKEIREELRQTERQILSLYPTIHMKAHKKGVRIQAERVEGLYKDYIIKKVFLIDFYHYLQPSYMGIIAKRVTDENTKGMQACEFEQDERIEVILFE